MKLMSFIIVASALIFVFALILAPEANADKEPYWKSYTVKENMNSLEKWAFKWPHTPDKDASWLTFEDRLRSAQLWVDIQMLKQMRKQMQKCQPAPQINNSNQLSTPIPYVKQDWTGLGGSNNTLNNAEVLR